MANGLARIPRAIVSRAARAAGRGSVVAIARVRSGAVDGLRGVAVRVEAVLTSGLPATRILGLPTAAVREGGHRVRSAIRQIGVAFPRGVLTVNLQPGHLRKEGPIYDLPIAVAILVLSGRIPARAVAGAAFAGELALDGRVLPVSGLLPIAIELREAGVESLVVSRENAAEAAAVEGLAVLAAESLADVAAHFGGESLIAPFVPREESRDRRDGAPAEDLSDVRGQASGKRALEIAAAGGHNVLFHGPPGSGKTMLARRLVSILPPLSREESLEVSVIHGSRSRLEGGLVRVRPFRAPHHTVSAAGLVGGGSDPRPGEVTLAHRGVLFLDELAEFGRHTLEILRQPLESGEVVIARRRGAFTFPARFLFVAATNPCPCGDLGHPTRPCRCTPAQVQRYHARVSGPLLDRIDLHVEVSPAGAGDARGEPSATVRGRVRRAREIQFERAARHGARSPAEMPAGRALEWAQVEKGGVEFLRAAREKLALSERAAERLVRVARTIADLGGHETVDERAVAEAVSYRARSFALAPDLAAFDAPARAAGER